MIKKILSLSLFLSLVFTNAQTNDFPYNQQWGTYTGGTGTHLLDYNHDGNGFSVDSQNNIYVSGITQFLPGYTNTYYDQFVFGGGNLADLSYIYNDYSAQYSTSGVLQKSGYISSGNVTNNTAVISHLIGIDKLDNKYFVKFEPGQISNLSTPNVWLSQNTDSTKNYTITLSKYDANQNLVWTTYVPNNEDGLNFMIRFDSNYDLYLVGVAKEEIAGLSTPNVYQENYINYASAGTSSFNSYLVKLNQAGQKIWASYFVQGIYDMEIYDGNMYTINGYNVNMPANLTTAGTFQPTIPAQQLLMKFDCATGNRQWGTYYGTSTINNYTGIGIYDLEVNETGLYITGHTADDSEPTYFATEGAFKSQLTGGGDYFLSKFDHNGERSWSTYFGTDGYEEIIGSPNLTILGSRIIFTGNQIGNAYNISTPNAFSTTPYNDATTASAFNIFFTEFDDTGRRMWTSYFGGPGGSYYGEQAQPELLSDGSLILWGTTGAATGIATANGAYPTMLNPSPGQSFGFVTKFALKVPLSTSEANETDDLQLFDNPNNGEFTLRGSVLEKEKTILKIYDISGRSIKNINLKKQKTQQFYLQKELPKGNYLLEIISDKGKKLKVFKMLVNK